MSTFARQYLEEVATIAASIPAERVDAMAHGLATVRSRGGRLFILGAGGGAAHASHAVNDFRKLCAFEAYAPSDNVSELTARVNDDGWETVFEAWLRVSRLTGDDALLIFSVGGGSTERNLSVNLVHAIELAKQTGAAVYGIVGRADGATAQRADVAIVVEAPDERITPHVESFQAVLWHLLVTHPELAREPGVWETRG